MKVKVPCSNGRIPLFRGLAFVALIGVTSQVRLLSRILVEVTTTTASSSSHHVVLEDLFKGPEELSKQVASVSYKEGRSLKEETHHQQQHLITATKDSSATDRNSTRNTASSPTASTTWKNTSSNIDTDALLYNQSASTLSSTNNNTTFSHHIWLPGFASPTEYRFSKARFQAIDQAASQRQQDDSSAIAVGVLSVGHKPEPRDWVRQTWASKHNVIFLIAGNWTQQLQDELDQHEDLLWIDRPESYRGITEKVAAWYAVAAQRLSHVPYILKTDDDVYARLHDILVDFVLPHNRNESLYLGYPCPAAQPVIRDPTNRWYVSRDDYAPDHYPPFAYGIGYILSQDIVSCMVHGNQMLQFQQRNTTGLQRLLPIEDAYTGILVQQCGGTCQSDNRFWGDDTGEVMYWDNMGQQRLRVYYTSVFFHGSITERRMHARHRDTCCRSLETWSRDPTCSNVAKSDCRWSVYKQDQMWLQDDHPTLYRFPKQRFASLKDDASNVTTTSVVVGVLSASDRVRSRAAIRQTWAWNLPNVLFVVGGDWTTELEQELETYEDLIWIDSSQTETAWQAVFARHFAKTTEYSIQTEDDVYLRLQDVVTDLRNASSLYWRYDCNATQSSGYILSKDLVSCFVARNRFFKPSRHEQKLDGTVHSWVQECGGQCQSEDRLWAENSGVMVWDGMPEKKRLNYYAKFLIQGVDTLARMERRHSESCCRSPAAWSKDPSCERIPKRMCTRWPATSVE